MRGAFTDAKEARGGIVAEAQRGTLFLDEIDSINIRAQVALLRFLEQREYRPVGGAAVKRADVRVIAASNADLELLVARRRFRKDLLYRLNVMSLNLTEGQCEGFGEFHPPAVSIDGRFDYPGG